MKTITIVLVCCLCQIETTNTTDRLKICTRMSSMKQARVVVVGGGGWEGEYEVALLLMIDLYTLRTQFDL
jgi:hypothetical protein